MAGRPTGTVTFLFTDIEGSTALLHELGAEQYSRTLDDHRRLLRSVFERHGGHEVDTQGDAFLVAFERARSAVAAASDSQLALVAHAWPDGRELLVRMGIHTCDATSTAEGYVGVGVHRGARICAAGHGGQVLISHTTHDLLEEEADGPPVLDLGEHRLKDLTQPQRLFQLADEQRTYPPLRTLDNRPTNLPVQVTPFVGRERELRELTELVRRDDVRLVTLTGPGGTGKTRLALQVAAELVEDFPHGVFLVGLAAIADPELVLPTIAQTLGVSETAGQSLGAYLATKRLLLVVDNVEHVLAAAPRLAELLTRAPQVELIATSREPLRVAAERVHPVPPLELPDPRRLPDLAALSQYEAVALFVERATAARPDFAVTNANAPAVAEICVRLDGLPLALELAAARIPLLSPEAMLRRLDERLTLLTSGPRDLPERQQTLRATLAWSYELLNERERRLFAALGIFAGGCTLEAAEAVCDADLDGLGSLVAKSILRSDGERFTMLSTIREYALERLNDTDGVDGLGDRHAAFFEQLAEQAYAERFEREAERSAELEREHDNLRAALDRLSRSDAERQVRLAGALGWFWHVHSHLSEGRARLAGALAGTDARDDQRARALAAAGELAAWQGDVAAAAPLIDEAVSIWRASGRDQEVALALHELGWGYFFAGDDEAARRCMDESLELQTELGRPLLVNRAQLGLLQVLVSLGEVETVERLGPVTLELAQQLGDLRYEHFAHHFLADCALIAGDCERAEESYRRSLDAARRIGDAVETCYELQGVAMAAAGLGRFRQALRIAGAADAQLAALGHEQSVAFWNALLERYLGPARDALGPDADGALEEGRRLGFESAVDQALALNAGAG